MKRLMILGGILALSLTSFVIADAATTTSVVSPGDTKELTCSTHFTGTFTDSKITAACAAVPTTTTIPTTQPPTTTAPPTTNPTTTTQPPTTRDFALWPCASTSPWNMPRGSGATFGGGITGGNPWLAQAGTDWNPAFYKSSNSDPLVHVTVWQQGSNPFPVDVHIPANAAVPGPPGGDGHMNVLQPDGDTLWSTWSFSWNQPGNPGAGAQTGTWAKESIRGSCWNAGWVRAAGVSGTVGSIRLHEANAAAQGKPHAIPHALAMAMPGGLYPLGPGGANPWPTNGNFGDHPGEGTLLAIPSSTAKPGNLTTEGSAMWDALRDYGAYDVDTTGGGSVSFFADEAVPDNTLAPIWSDLNTLVRALRVVTNNTPSTPGGPGTRLAPMAP